MPHELDILKVFEEDAVEASLQPRPHIAVVGYDQRATQRSCTSLRAHNGVPVMRPMDVHDYYNACSSISRCWVRAVGTLGKIDLVSEGTRIGLHMIEKSRQGPQEKDCTFLSDSETESWMEISTAILDARRKGSFEANAQTSCLVSDVDREYFWAPFVGKTVSVMGLVVRCCPKCNPPVDAAMARIISSTLGLEKGCGCDVEHQQLHTTLVLVANSLTCAINTNGGAEEDFVELHEKAWCASKATTLESCKSATRTCVLSGSHATMASGYFSSISPRSVSMVKRENDFLVSRSDLFLGLGLKRKISSGHFFRGSDSDTDTLGAFGKASSLPRVRELEDSEWDEWVKEPFNNNRSSVSQLCEGVASCEAASPPSGKLAALKKKFTL